MNENYIEMNIKASQFHIAYVMDHIELKLGNPFSNWKNFQRSITKSELVALAITLAVRARNNGLYVQVIRYTSRNIRVTAPL